MIENELTIVCATHNNEKKLFNTINNLSKSTILPKNIIIVTTNDVYKKYFNKIYINSLNILFYISEKKSQTFQRKLGIEAANTKYIIQIDDDVLVEKNCIKNMLIEIKKNKNTIIGGYLMYSNNTHIYERFTKSYNNSYILKFVYKLLNNFKEPNNMSILKSGRIFPRYINGNTTPEWLSSFMIYEKKIYNKGKKINSKGKGYFEDVVFTNSLFKKGFKLLIKENCKAIVEDVEYTGINTYLKSLPNFIKLLNLLNKSKLLFLIDCLIFFNIHLLISIFNIFKIEIHKK